MIIKKNNTPKDHLLELIEKGDKKYIHFLALYQYNYILEHLPFNLDDRQTNEEK